MSTEDEVRKASEQFYAALNRMANGDAGAVGKSAGTKSGNRGSK
jgi:hypothetical protein